MQKKLQYKKKEPNNPMVLINVARVNHELENYGNAQIAYKKLKKRNHERAAKYSYLELKGDASLKAFEGDKVRLKHNWDKTFVSRLCFVIFGCTV